MAEINEDPDLKEHFDTQMIAVTNLIGQLTPPKCTNPDIFL